MENMDKTPGFERLSPEANRRLNMFNVGMFEILQNGERLPRVITNAAELTAAMEWAMFGIGSDETAGFLLVRQIFSEQLHNLLEREQ